MNKYLLTKINGDLKKYEIIIDFTSNEYHKNYIFYKENNKIKVGSYIIEDGLYIIKPIVSEDEKLMCNSVFKDLYYN